MSKKLIKSRITISIILVLVISLLYSTSCKKPARSFVEGDTLPNKGVVVVDKKGEQKIDIFIDGNLFTSYLYNTELEKPILFPVRASSGTVITRGFPLQPGAGETTDHPHQVGAWFNYGDVNGFDFWGNSYAIPEAEKAKYGRIVHRQVNRAISQDHIGVVEVEMDWMVQHDLLLPAISLLHEKSVFEFSGNGTTRTVDRFITLTATSEDVRFNDTKEGLYAIRVDRAFEYPSEEPQILTDEQGNPSQVPVVNNEGVNGCYRNSNGVDGTDVWGKRADWVILSAKKNEEKLAIIIFDHKLNPGSPAYWHARGYGLFSINNLGQKTFSEGKEELNLSLKKGESVTFRYRIMITSGYVPADDELNRVYREFSTKK